MVPQSLMPSLGMPYRAEIFTRNKHDNYMWIYGNLWGWIYLQCIPFI